MASFVADASAILALIKRETGWERVAAVTGVSVISTVNLCEVLAKLVLSGASLQTAQASLSVLGLTVVDFTEALAVQTAALALSAVRALSLGDRACLALAAERGLPALTADRAWRDIDLGVEVILIR